MTNNAGDGLVIAGGYCSEIRFLDAACGDLQSSIVLNDFGHVNCLGVSRDSHSLAVAGNPHVRCYDMHTHTPVNTYEGHKTNVTSIAFAATGRWLYTGSEDGTMRVWDCRSQKCQMCYENQGSFALTAIHAVDLHPNQKELVAGDNQGKVLVWDIEANQIRRILIPDDGVPVQSISIAPHGDRVVCANHSGDCYAWHLSADSWDLLTKVDAHSAYVLRCVFSPDGEYLATASADGLASYWRSHGEGFTCCSTLSGHSKMVWDCCFTVDGQRLVTGSSDCTCRIWDLQSGSQQLEVSCFKKGVTAVAVAGSQR